MQRQVHDRLRRTLVVSATAIALGVAILAPLLFGAASYRGEARYLRNQTELIAQNLTRFIYRFPETWTFQAERVGDLVRTSLFAEGIRVRVMEPGGATVVAVGADPAYPALTRTRSVEDGGLVIGWVETSIGLLPVLLETLLIFAVSCGLAGGVLVVLRRIPLRALGQAVVRLDGMFAAVEASEERLKEAQRIAHLGSWSYDFATKRTAWSAEIARILGLPPDVPMDIDVVIGAIHSEDRKSAEQAFRQLTSVGRDLGLSEVRIVRPDWAVRHLEVSAEIKRRPDGEPVRVDGILHDVTERRTAEEKHRHLALELARLSGRSSIEEMAASLARELRQFLGAVTSCARDARRGLAGRPGSTADVDDALVEVLRQADLAGQTVERVLRLAAREDEPARRAIDLNAIIRDAIDLVRSEAESRDVVVDLDLAGDLPRVSADAAQIAQVVVNMARNGVEAIAGVECPQRMLKVSTGRRNGSRVWLQVEGLGVGIADDARGKLFYPYMASKPGGVASGLLICQRIVESHAGEFTIGDKMGGGVVASFTLPVAREASAVGA